MCLVCVIELESIYCIALALTRLFGPIDLYVCATPISVERFSSSSLVLPDTVTVTNGNLTNIHFGSMANRAAIGLAPRDADMPVLWRYSKHRCLPLVSNAVSCKSSEGELSLYRTERGARNPIWPMHWLCALPWLCFDTALHYITVNPFAH